MPFADRTDDDRPQLARAALAQREEAQGVELFEDPDAAVPRDAVAEGPPGHETLAEAGFDDAEDYERDRRAGLDEA